MATINLAEEDDACEPTLIEELTVNGLGGGDKLTLTGSAGDDHENGEAATRQGVVVNAGAGNEPETMGSSKAS